MPSVCLPDVEVALNEIIPPVGTTRPAPDINLDSKDPVPDLARIDHAGSPLPPAQAMNRDSIEPMPDPARISPTRASQWPSNWFFGGDDRAVKITGDQTYLGDTRNGTAAHLAAQLL